MYQNLGKTCSVTQECPKCWKTWRQTVWPTSYSEKDLQTQWVFAFSHDSFLRSSDHKPTLPNLFRNMGFVAELYLLVGMKRSVRKKPWVQKFWEITGLCVFVPTLFCHRVKVFLSSQHWPLGVYTDSIFSHMLYSISHFILTITLRLNWLL